MSGDVLFDLEPVEPPEPGAWEPPVGPQLTERVMLDLLHQRYSQGAYPGGPGRYVCAEQVRARWGFEQRTADFIAVDTWSSGGLAIHGVEVKVSRGDWLRELKDPDKAGVFMGWCTHWWLAAAHGDVCRREELPPGWGLMCATPRGLLARVSAPRRKVDPPPRGALASLLRAVAITATVRAVR